MRIQIYPKWHIGHDKILATLGDNSWYDHYIFLGPIQISWSGKPWLNRLKRSPKYTEEMKKTLLEDLNSVKYKHISK